MAFNFFGMNVGKNDNDEESKNAERVQDYVNRFKIQSRDLKAKNIKNDKDGSDWQGYSWVQEATTTSENREIRYTEYREMCKVPELNQGLNIFADNCLHPDTKIWTLKGEFTIKQLSEMYTKDESFELWSYNIEEHKVDIGLAKNVRKTLENADVYKVSFDNGTSIVATANHPFLLKTGKYKNLENLVPGDRIIPFYARIKDNIIMLLITRFNLYNHKVVSIEPYGKSDVYDLEVEKFHNFNANGVFVHNSTQYNISKDVLEIQSDNNKIVEILEELFFDKLDINANIWAYAKNMCKFGDEFIEVIPDNKKNPRHVAALERVKKPERIKREEVKGNLQKFIWESKDVLSNEVKQKIFQPWQMIHLKIDDEDFDPYGKSVLEAGRKVWKRLTLMEDAMLIYRISRAPERRVFYIDVGTLSTKEANKYVEQLKRRFKKKQFINPTTGEIDEKANPLCITLDTKIPLLDGRSVQLSDLIKEQNEGKENWVYSINTENNQIVPGKIIWADITRKNAKLVKVVLDNGKELRTTPDHKFMLRDGSYKEAQHLIEGEALMPLYTKLSSKEDGDRINGYEKVYNPRTQTYEYTHRIVSKTILTNEWNRVKKGRTTHHKDFDKSNNNPDNLDIMNIWEHRELHNAILEKTLLRPEVIEENRKRIIRYNHSDKHKIDVSSANKRRNSVAAMSWYNGSELHKEHNIIRSENLKKQFSDPELRKKYIDGMTIRDKITDKFWELLKNVAQNTKLNKQGYISITNVLENTINDDGLMQEWKSFCKPNKQSSGPNRHFMVKAFREFGFESSEQWLNEVAEVPTKNNRYEYQNHKVVKIEWLDYKEDTGDITVDVYHNFATEAGVFVHNSIDEDFYIPVRQDSTGTRIETLPPGLNLGEIDDVKYFKDQILKTMGIPSGYIAGPEGGGTYDPKSFLSQQDIQFSRTIERIQRFLVKGLEKVAMIELIFSKEIEEDQVTNFKIVLTPPSNVDQLMEIEIRNQQFALISQIKSIEGFLPDEWVYKEILGFTEKEINKIKLQIQMQMQMQAQTQAMYGGEGGGAMTGGASGGNISGFDSAPATAGGPEEIEPGGEEAGGEEPAEAPGLEVSGNKFVEFDGGNWLIENVKDVKKLLKYIHLYEKVHKDNNEPKRKEHNSLTRMVIEGEFRGMLKIARGSNNHIKTIIEDKFKAPHKKSAKTLRD